MTDRQYPYQDGDVTVLGPEIFASPDGAVICWKGVNYERQAAAVVPAADRVALVELAAQAMREHYIVTNREEADADGNLPCCCGGWREPGPMGSDEDDYDSHLADAVLSVLPAPVDRSAVLREAADRIETLMDQAYERALSDHEIGWANGLEDAMRELRRMAAAVPAVGVAADTPPAAAPNRFEWIIERCPDHGCVEPELTVCCCEVVDRLRADAAPGACAECGHPHSVHVEGDDPVTPGSCADCPDDDRHDFTPQPGMDPVHCPGYAKEPSTSP